MERRTFLAGLSTAAIASSKSRAAAPPRKVIVGTAMQAFWVPYPGLEKRLAELTALVNEMTQQAKMAHGRGLDLAILPETAITGEAGSDALARSVPYAGAVAEAFQRAAQQNNCYIVVPTYLREAYDSGRCSNAAILIDRKGEAVGTYRKVHLVVAGDGKTMEGGSTPGSENPVFDCDFGKLGIQICYDMEFDRGWNELSAKGAEIIAWPTQSPQTTQPAARAAANRCYIVSSTWRHNASVFEPTGKLAAQIKPPERVLVHELDLSFAILPWSSKLRHGKALADLYGDRVGYRYYEDEDLGLFWSNDQAMPIGKMMAGLGLVEAEDELARVRDAYRRAGMKNY